MADPSTVTRVGYPAALVAVFAAAVLGWGIGTWLGSAGSPVTPAGPVALASPSPTATPTPTPTPTATPMPTAAPSVAPPTAGPPTDPPPPTTILEIEGTGDEVSEPFEVVEGWQIVWQTDGTAFAFAIRGDQDVGQVVRQSGPSSGVTSIVPVGSFYLEITATGPWSIKVVQNS